MIIGQSLAFRRAKDDTEVPARWSTTDRRTTMNSNHIQRIGESLRWSDVVIYNGTARWVEVANDMTEDVRSQVAQVLQQIDSTLEQIGSDRHSLLEIMIYLADLADAAVLNDLWDAWGASRSCSNQEPACRQGSLATAVLR